jgi:hypothetical protein
MLKKIVAGAALALTFGATAQAKEIPWWKSVPHSFVCDLDFAWKIVLDDTPKHLHSVLGVHIEHHVIGQDYLRLRFVGTDDTPLVVYDMQIPTPDLHGNTEGGFGHGEPGVTASPYLAPTAQPDLWTFNMRIVADNTVSGMYRGTCRVV